MNNVSSNWQYSLNTSLVNRLNRPLYQPGMMKMSMSQRIINRCDRLLNRLPLLGQQMQRWGHVNTAVPNDVPIVYAQPISVSNQPGIENGEQNFQSTIPVIQRKEKLIDNSTISENITPSLPLENQINQTSTSSSEIPVISSQPTSEQLTETGKIPLQSNSKNDNISVPLIQKKSDNSQSSTIKSVNNIATSENITYLSGSNLSDNITPALPLENQINQTSISSSRNPVVSSQPISEELTETGQYQQLPIIQIKQHNYDLSSSHLPVTNPLNNLTSSKQAQLEKNSEKINSSNKENLVAETSLTNLPIVTTQPSTDKINSTEKEISINRNYSNYPNNHHLPVVPITSSIKTPEQNQSLPLTKNSSSSQIINNSQPNLSNNNSSAPPKVLPSPSSSTETIVSPLANQSNSTNSNIDVDTIVNQVERKLMRRLVIESERRGKIR
ncbi:hypothetical protein NIES267_42750 [Calothrix parasitica NIES-267]|uniref:Uncharacterized protein n=1 Tax=Calothrix parasitica NIES-267 TaxID=1973488 RepID=A0A1Z4LUN1_9CYAN|nr:hypothetical protein NIES267_42750 [Calothrix parasitica NIES-267]